MCRVKSSKNYGTIAINFISLKSNTCEKVREIDCTYSIFVYFINTTSILNGKFINLFVIY